MIVFFFTLLGFTFFNSFFLLLQLSIVKNNLIIRNFIDCFFYFAWVYFFQFIFSSSSTFDCQKQFDNLHFYWLFFLTLLGFTFFNSFFLLLQLSIVKNNLIIRNFIDCFFYFAWVYFFQFIFSSSSTFDCQKQFDNLHFYWLFFLILLGFTFFNSFFLLLQLSIVKNNLIIRNFIDCFFFTLLGFTFFNSFFLLLQLSIVKNNLIIRNFIDCFFYFAWVYFFQFIFSSSSTFDCQKQFDNLHFYWLFFLTLLGFTFFNSFFLLLQLSIVKNSLIIRNFIDCFFFYFAWVYFFQFIFSSSSTFDCQKQFDNSHFY